MKEDLLHFVWRTRKFDLKDLLTTQKESIRIDSFGNHNHHQGPDFSNARVSISDTLWAGNVEMHLQASEWYQHKHQDDPAYDNVILHVVWEEDKPVIRRDGSRIPCLELKGRISSKIIANYQQLLSSENWVPCARHLHKVKEVTLKFWLESLAVQRLKEKSELLQHLYAQTTNNLEETLYIVLLSNYGIPHNKDAFEQLGRSLPLKLLEQYRSQPKSIEALLFGTAGFLSVKGPIDEYTQSLVHEFDYLKTKHHLTPLPLSLWKFGSMRPGSFPTLRLAQFISIFSKNPRLLDTLLEATSVSELYQLFDCSLSPYWQSHFRLSDEGKAKNKQIGRGTLDVFILNGILPFLFFYASIRDRMDVQERAFEILQKIPTEKNSILAKWNELGVEAQNAMDSQALIHLKKHYCTHRKCMDCAIGASIIQQ